MEENRKSQWSVIGEMSKGRDTRFMTYWERVKFYRNRNKPVHNILRYWLSGNLSFKQKFRKTYLEVALFYNGLKKIFREVRTYGEMIKRGYGVSKTKQFMQQFYLYFIIGVPCTLSYYREFLLFKADRWKSVSEFTYFNEPIERDFIVRSLPGAGEYNDEYDIFKDKIQFYCYCRARNIPTPEISSVITIPESSSAHTNIQLPTEDIFIKIADGACGYGAAKFKFRNNRYLDVKGRAYTSEEVLSYLTNGKKSVNKFIIQPVLQNHKDWMPFTSGALATCRVLTGRRVNGGEIVPISAVLRMPVKSLIADNYSLGGLASAIDLNTGKMGTAVCSKPVNGFFEFDRHPDTGQKLQGTRLPGWRELLAFAVRVHETFDFIFVGWDIAYTTEGLVVVEGNGIWGGDLHEFSHNEPLTKTRYPELFDEWMEHFADSGEIKSI